MTNAKRPMNPLTVVLLLSGLFFAVFLVISVIVFFTRPFTSRSGVGGAIFSSGSVGIIELNGVINDSKRTLRRLERFDEDGDIKAVVMRLNSPGGSVAPSQEIYEAVRKYKKPIVVSMGSVAASGAYYIACGAKKVFANPGTITGSIGVIMEFLDLRNLYDWAKVRRYSIKTGAFKDAGADYREMTDEERRLLQGMVDDVLGQFRKAVVEGRKLTPEQVAEVSDGRIFSGAQAHAAKLVDELGTLQDAIDEAARMANLKGKPRVVYPERPRQRLLQQLISDSASDDGDASSAASASSEGAARWGGVLRVIAAAIGWDAPGLRSLEQNLAVQEPGIYWLWTGSR